MFREEGSKWESPPMTLFFKSVGSIRSLLGALLSHFSLINAAGGMERTLFKG